MSDILDLQVGASADDAFQDTSNSVYLEGLGSTVDAATEHFGLRFIGTVPSGATVDITRLGVYIQSSALDEPQHQVRGQAAAAPVTFTTTANDIDGRTRTAASFQWNSAGLGAATDSFWEWGATVAGAGNGTNIASIVQENVDALGELTTLVFIIEQHTEDSTRDLGIWFYDGNTTLAPKLHIEYTAGGAARRIFVIST